MIGFNNLGNMGRLGNQMFEYATLRGIAANKKYDWCIPPFNIKGIENYSLDRAFTLPSVQERNLMILDNGHAPVVGERYFHFDKELFDLCPDHISLNGFFQTEKYFKHIEQEIKSDFTFRDEIYNPCKEMISSLDNPIALHIRRTDYITNPNHTCLGMDYYEKALKLFPNETVLIFSDDPQWCQKQELFSDDRFLVSDNDDAYIDMCLMTMCKGHIIANSSFSWWGAWLSNSRDVIAPSKWFGPNNAHLDTKDLYCEGWTLI